MNTCISCDQKLITRVKPSEYENVDEIIIRIKCTRCNARDKRIKLAKEKILNWQWRLILLETNYGKDIEMDVTDCSC